MDTATQAAAGFPVKGTKGDSTHDAARTELVRVDTAIQTAAGFPVKGSDGVNVHPVTPLGPQLMSSAASTGLGPQLLHKVNGKELLAKSVQSPTGSEGLNAAGALAGTEDVGLNAAGALAGTEV